MAFISGDRRRRVLTDKLATAAESEVDSNSSSAAAKSAAAPGPAYEADAITRVASITDLVPHSKWKLTLAWFLLIGLTAGIVALDIYSPDWSFLLSAESLAPLKLAAPAGLAAWFQTLLLIWTAGLCGIIFAVRRHRTDDYKGRYRLWATAAVCWLVLGMAHAAGLGQIFRELGIHSTKWQGWRAGTMWWLAPLAAVYGIALLRMALDMRRAPLCLFVLLLAAGSWSASLAMEFGWLKVNVAPAELVQSTLSLTGHVLLVCSLLAYGRLVTLQAAGKIVAVAVPRKKKEKAVKKKTTKTSSKTKSKTTASKRTKTTRKQASTSDAENEDDEEAANSSVRWGSKPSQPASISKSSGSTSSQTDSDDEDDFGGRQKLSKAERKRLRRERSRSNRAA